MNSLKEKFLNVHSTHLQSKLITFLGKFGVDLSKCLCSESGAEMVSG